MKQIIILTQARGTGLGDTQLRYIFWFAVPLARRVVDNTRVSLYAAATQLEIDAIRNGSVHEEGGETQIPPGKTVAQVKTLLEARYAARFAELAALPDPNKFYGAVWDGTSWTGGT